MVVTKRNKQCNKNNNQDNNNNIQVTSNQQQHQLIYNINFFNNVDNYKNLLFNNQQVITLKTCKAVDESNNDTCKTDSNNNNIDGVRIHNKNIENIFNLNFANNNHNNIVEINRKINDSINNKLLNLKKHEDFFNNNNSNISNNIFNLQYNINNNLISKKMNYSSNNMDNNNASSTTNNHNTQQYIEPMTTDNDGVIPLTTIETSPQNDGTTQHDVGAYRKSKERPLRKLSIDMIETYKKINEVCFFHFFCLF